MKNSVVKKFHTQGYLFYKNVLDKKKVATLKQTFHPSLWIKEEGMIFEMDEKTPRSLFNLHNLNPDLIKNLIKGRWTTLSYQLLESNSYIYQSHINYKKGLSKGGEYWWHSDYIFWRFEDGMQEPEAISFIFFLDTINIKNGALQVIPKSHKFIYTDKLNRKSKNANINIRHNLSVDTKKDYAKEGLLTTNDLQQIKQKPHTIEGQPGDLLIMDANLWHASFKNKSPVDRRMMFIVVNSLNNQPHHVYRPDYLVEQNINAFKLEIKN